MKIQRKELTTSGITFRDEVCVVTPFPGAAETKYQRPCRLHNGNSRFTVLRPDVRNRGARRAMPSLTAGGEPPWPLLASAVFWPSLAFLSL